MTPRTALFSSCALLGFVTNSLSCRLALRHAEMDAATFTTIRLASGAGVLWLLLRLRHRDRAADAAHGVAVATGPPAWSRLVGPLALFVYAATFSFACTQIDTGPGALVLFGAVQLTMIGWGIRAGERPTPIQWGGLVVAGAGLALLLLPGSAAPPLAVAATMGISGLAWGVYSLQGRGSRGAPDPVRRTAMNFAYALPCACLASAIFAREAHASSQAILLAVFSGAVASGVGYSLWYAAVRELSAMTAAVVQLCVPVLVAVGGVVLLGEHVGPRAIVAGIAILGGIALAITVRETASEVTPRLGVTPTRER